MPTDDARLPLGSVLLATPRAGGSVNFAAPTWSRSRLTGRLWKQASGTFICVVTRRSLVKC
jgi:hypothetical protein